MSGEVPDTWAVKTVGEIASITMGQSPPSSTVSDDGDGLPFIQGNAEFGARYPKPRQFAADCPKVVEGGDILLSVRAPVGEVNVAPERLCIGRGLAGLRPTEGDHDFLYYALGGLAPVFARLSQGSTFDAINGKDLRSIPLLVPPLDEQRRIAEVLRSVDEAIAANEAVAMQANCAFQATLAELIGNVLAHWETARLGQIAELTLGKMLDKEKNKGELRPYLANINVRWGAFDMNDLRHMRFEERERERYGLRCGDIVMCEGGEPGRCALWIDEGADMMIQKALHRIRPHKGVDSRYLYYALVHGVRSGAYDEYMTGSGIKHLPGNQLAKVEVSLPPFDEQRQIAETLCAVEQAAMARQTAFDHARELKANLMSDLLSGRVRVPA